jgi:probable rRNA maturation factor
VIEIANAQKRVRIPAGKVRELARRLLGRRSLSVAFVTDAAMRRINRKHLGHDRATDVLAFPLGGDPWGELVISAETARREARGRGLPVAEELLRYVAHGCLHLLGYDDHEPAARRRMWERQERELRRLKGKS